MALTKPTQITVPFASSGLKNTIPETATGSNRASMQEGFPAITMQDVDQGGMAPYGQDMNGIIYDVTKAIQYQQAGGFFPYDATFAAAIDGYPIGAIVTSADGTQLFQNTLDGNQSDPENGGANWSNIMTSASLAGKQDKLNQTQMDAVNSGITSAKVAIYDSYASTKQNTLTFDNTPTNGSSNPVTSDGIYAALGTKQDNLTIDATPASGSTNPVSSGGVYTALSGKVDISNANSAEVTATGSTTARTLANWMQDLTNVRSDVRNTFRKKLFLEVDFHFDGYNDAKTAISSNNIFPQAADVSGDNLYVLYVSSNPTALTKQIVATFNLKTGAFIRWNVLDPCRGGQWIVAREESGTDYLYVSDPTTYKILKFQTSATSGASLTAITDDCNNITSGSFVSYNNGRWFVMGIDRMVNTGRASAVWVYDDNWNKIGSWAWRDYDFDLLEQDYNDPIARSVQHKQGLVFGANTAYVFSGGSTSFGDGVISDIGIIEHDFYGNVIRSSVCDSAKFRTKAASIAGGTVNSNENESGIVLPDGRVLSLIVFNSGDARRLTFWEEFSLAEDATDFSDCAAVRSNVPWLCDARQFPKMDNNDSQSGISGDHQGDFYNPFTNEKLTSLDDAIVMMCIYGFDRLVFSCPKSWTTLNGNTIFVRDGTINDTENYTVELIRNTNGCVFANFFYRNNTGAKEYNCSYRVNVNSTTWAVSSATLLGYKADSLYSNKLTLDGTNEGIILQSKDTAVVRIDGGTNWGNGASIVVGGKGVGSGTNTRSGGIEMRTSQSSAGTGGDERLRLIRTGEMTWTGDYINPHTTNKTSLGDASHLYKEIFCSTATINTSDERIKQDISDISDEVLDAWGDVSLQVFKFKDAVAKKGVDARIHTGVIAQQVQSAFEAHGLDAFSYGLLCYDEWEASEAIYDEIKVVDKPEIKDEDGTVIQKEEFHIDRELVSPSRPSGNLYSIRYEEALILEAAYQRRRADRIEARLKALEERMA